MAETNSNQNAILDKIKSEYILKNIFENLSLRKTLEIIRYNKNLQNKLNKDIKSYKEYLKIEIELILSENSSGKFINLDDISHCHIFFDDNKEDMKKTYAKKSDKVTKIKLILDYEIKTLYKLFKECRTIKKINFKKFNRKDIYNISYIFYNCSSLEEINLSNLNNNNFTDLIGMFYGCSSLKELNLKNFNTINAYYMSSMFYNCSSLEKINLDNFNTSNVVGMSKMFYNCKSLEELNISNFNTSKVIDMSYMFYNCYSLKELNLNNFNTSKIKI